MYWWNPGAGTIVYYPKGAVTETYLRGRGWRGPYRTRAQAQKAAQGSKKNAKKPAPSGAAIVAAARSWFGVPYLYGGTTRRGVDCSGLVQQVANSVGIRSCPRTSELQWAWCQHISASQAGAGDLVFFTGAEIDPPPGHVGILVAPGLMIDAPYTGTVVQQQHFSDGPGVNRIIGYGRMRGATGSTTANNNYQTKLVSQGGLTAVESAGSVIVTGVIIVMLVVIVALLVGTGLLFKGVAH